MRKLSYREYFDKVYGCFIGKAVTGNIGAPYEGVKMPMSFAFSPDMIDCSMPNDDLDLQILWLDVLEDKGPDFTAADLLKKFCDSCDYNPGEYSVMRKNYMRGVMPPYSGKFCNDFYIEGMGCPIRSEVWACVAAGNPELACRFAVRDGQLDHYGESIEAERFMVTLEAEAFFESDIPTLIEKALAVLPKESKFAQLVRSTVSWCRELGDIRQVLSKILFHYGHPDCTNLYENMGITVASLLLGEGDIIKTGMMALNCGFDTDCTCATAGAVIGIIRGGKAMIRDYDLTEITYTLGVRANERSNSIEELSREITDLGVKLTEEYNKEFSVTDCPDTLQQFSFPAAPALSLTVDYEDMEPYVVLGGDRKVILTLTNNSDRELAVDCALLPVNGLVCDFSSFPLTVPAKGSAKKEVSFFLPADTNPVKEKNIIGFTARCCEEVLLQDSFGVVCATPWKLSGPIWRTEPTSTTEEMMHHLSEKHPYKPLMANSRIEGNAKDKTRHFHLNFAVDTDTDYLGEKELFSPVDGKAVFCEKSGSFVEQSSVSIPTDSFSLSDFFGFRGPCVAYLSRVLVAEEDTTLYAQIGHTAPFALYINGEKTAERKYCDTFTSENVHIGPLTLKKGENRIVLRCTQVNENAKFSLIFSSELSMGEHAVDFGSVNPLYFEN